MNSWQASILGASKVSFVDFLIGEEVLATNRRLRVFDRLRTTTLNRN
jgi:hypothetical protein